MKEERFESKANDYKNLSTSANTVKGRVIERTFANSTIVKTENGWLATILEHLSPKRPDVLNCFLKSGMLLYVVVKDANEVQVPAGEI